MPSPFNVNKLTSLYLLEMHIQIKYKSRVGAASPRPRDLRGREARPGGLPRPGHRCCAHVRLSGGALGAGSHAGAAQPRARARRREAGRHVRRRRRAVLCSLGYIRVVCSWVCDGPFSFFFFCISLHGQGLGSWLTVGNWGLFCFCSPGFCGVGFLLRTSFLLSLLAREARYLG